MPRTSKRRWFPPRQCWRYRIDSRTCYAPRTIGLRDEAAAWRWATPLMSGDSVVEVFTVAEVRASYLQDLEQSVLAGHYKRKLMKISIE
jgi:hypothetical protein